MGPFRRISATVAIMSAALLGMSQASAIAAPARPALASAPALPGGKLGLDNMGSSPNTRAFCIFYTRGDYVHVSSSAFEASGHGWWVNGNCRATSAVVTVQLQQYYSDGRWRNAGSLGRATVRSGGGAGNRATGRAGCYNRSLTSWRSVIDVDLIGVADDPSKLTTPTRNISCRR